MPRFSQNALIYVTISVLLLASSADARRHKSVTHTGDGSTCYEAGRPIRCPWSKAAIIVTIVVCSLIVSLIIIGVWVLKRRKRQAEKYQQVTDGDKEVA